MDIRRRNLRVLLFPCPFEGHWNPMLHLATLLHSHGFSISILHTRFNSPHNIQISKYPDFHFVPIDDDGSPEKGAATRDLMGLIAALNISCARPFHDRVSQMLADDRPPVACLISDALMHFTQTVADRLNLPRIIFRTSSITSFVICAAFPLLRRKGYLPIRDPQSEVMVSELPPLRVRDLPNIGTDKADNLYQLVSNMINETKNSVGVISNSFDHLETTSLAKIRQEFHIPIFPIGPLHKHSPGSSSGSLLAHDRSCMTWLHQQAPGSVIYVSLGSLVVLSEEEMEEMAWGLADSNQPFLWVVRPGSVRGSEEVELPQGFRERTVGRGRIVDWAPQSEVLAHPAVGGFFTHCGWNSTLESVSEGVPMLCWPCFGDQRVNARFVSHVWKIGLPLENGLNRSKIERGIRRLMVDKEGKEMTSRVRILKAEAGESLKKGGSSYEALHGLIDLILSLS